MQQVCQNSSPDNCVQALQLEAQHAQEWQQAKSSVPVPAEWQKSDALVNQGLADLVKGCNGTAAGINNVNGSAAAASKTYVDRGQSELIAASQAVPYPDANN